MRILIVSDTHRKHENLKEILRRVKPLDLLIHLGDAEGEERSIERLAGCSIAAVRGNNDFFSDLPKERELQLGRYRALLTHGHYYYVNTGIANIKREAVARRFDIVMFGHTHRPIVDHDNHIIALNPGSISYPRQDGRHPSCIWMEIDASGEAHFDILYL